MPEEVVIDVQAVIATIDPKATYLLSLLKGERALSGADLKGAARTYSGKYRETRRWAADLCRKAGGHIRKGPHGKLTLEWSRAPRGAGHGSCPIGKVRIY